MFSRICRSQSVLLQGRNKEWHLGALESVGRDGCKPAQAQKNTFMGPESYYKLSGPPLLSSLKNRLRQRLPANASLGGAMAGFEKCEKRKIKAGKEKSEYSLMNWSQLHNKTQLVSWQRGTSPSGCSKPLSLGRTYKRKREGRIYWSAPLGLSSPYRAWTSITSRFYHLPLDSQCGSWLPLREVVFALRLKVVGRVRGSLGIVGVNSDNRIAPTMTSSLGSCRNLSLKESRECKIR